jgi:hypothetical protein
MLATRVQVATANSEFQQTESGVKRALLLMASSTSGDCCSNGGLASVFCFPFRVLHCPAVEGRRLTMYGKPPPQLLNSEWVPSKRACERMRASGSSEEMPFASSSDR